MLIARTRNFEKQMIVIFDRDGTLIQDYPFNVSAKKIHWLDFAKESIKILKEEGIQVVVATNQSGIAKGKFDESELKIFHNEMNRQLSPHAQIDEFFYCPHHEDGSVAEYSFKCCCRKPGNKMVEDIKRYYQASLDNLVFIGNTETDRECADRSGVRYFDVRHTNLQQITYEVLELKSGNLLRSAEN
jgi:D-glycero-D-manno-heptose 1,7-bisphosphate phosphatase